MLLSSSKMKNLCTDLIYAKFFIVFFVRFSPVKACQRQIIVSMNAWMYRVFPLKVKRVKVRFYCDILFSM